MGSCSSQGSTHIIHPIDFEGIQVICKTWKKTYSNLFDYNAPPSSLEINLLNITKNTKLIKSNGSYNLVSQQQQSQQQNHQIDATIEFNQYYEKSKTKQQKIFSLDSKIPKSRQHPWITVKSLPEKQYALKEGDLLRIGKQKIRIKELINKISNQKPEDQPIISNYSVYENITKEGKGLELTEQELENYQCRFCLDTGQKNNPLLAPCNCAGSSKYVHLKCVQIWLTKSINPRTVGKATVITWKPLICELCHKTLPFKVYLDGRRYFTVNIPKPQKPYLVLNPLIYQQKQETKNKIYYLVSFAECREMIIGRKKDSDIIISDDSSVSRHHSKMVFSNCGQGQGKFFLIDNGSKFGTLVLLKKQLILKKYLSNITLQVGGDLIQIRYGGSTTRKQEQKGQDLLNITLSDDSEDFQQEQDHNKNQSSSPVKGQDNEAEENSPLKKHQPENVENSS